MKRSYFTSIAIFIYLIFLSYSFLTGLAPGIESGKYFVEFATDLIVLLPPIFILIGLFEVWVSRESIEKHLGKSSGVKGYLWMLLLAGVSVGGMYTAFPVGASLFRKGAGLKYVFTYIGAAAVCRVPMTIFEASYLGLKFTLIRFLVSLPLVILTAVLMGSYLEKKGYKIYT